MKEYIEVLKQVIDFGPIDKVDDSTDPPSSLIKELYDEGLVDAIDDSSFDGLAYMDVKITMYGRQWLENQTFKAVGSEKLQSEDIIVLKPNFMGLGLNLNALWRKWFSKKT